MEEKHETAHQKALKEELEWVRQNAKGRQAKSKARLAKYIGGFLNRVATHMLAFKGNSEVVWFEGNLRCLYRRQKMPCWL